jgi:hypothetical protein
VPARRPQLVDPASQRTALHHHAAPRTSQLRKSSSAVSQLVLAELFEQFLIERPYLKNVTDRTLVWYQVAFRNYRQTLPGDAPTLPTKATL